MYIFIITNMSPKSTNTELPFLGMGWGGKDNQQPKSNLLYTWGPAYIFLRISFL